ncbi:Crp/Fnr family transcriptional regulator [Rhodopseudomonas sp. B29]|uniref:Crp/Fnr family transcriptional regulator n=1 Tax=Rhodopseudomonas sp. B29 TaxID=95607 RepID=UPI00034B9798|nr:Crp/Fnr family transcriptional regulator [Rhodopseudomonas sp. B29]
MATARPSANLILGNLPSEDFDLLRPHLRNVELSFGQILIEAGETVHRVYFPHSGIVSIMARLRRGETIEVAAIGRDGVIGDGAALHEVPSPGAAIVRFPGVASAIDATYFRAAVDQSPSLREALMRHQWVRTLKAEQTVACNAAHSAEERLCRRLYQSRELSGSDAMLLSQDMMAQMLGVKRNTISLIAHALQQQGVIRYSRGRMLIVNVDELARRACECHVSDRLGSTSSELRDMPPPRPPLPREQFQRIPS